MSEIPTIVTSIHRRLQIVLVAVTCGLVPLSFYNGQYLSDQALQHVPTVLALAALAWAARRGTMSDASLACLLAFVWLHILGARYIYSFVPYEEWCRGWLGESLAARIHTPRNHYDRLVHFAYGALAVVPQLELLQRRGRMSRGSAYFFSLVLVLACSAAYEIFEWLLAVMMAPEWADHYNGQQGDLWDAQQDMALAGLGAVLMTAVLSVVQRRRR